MHSNAKNKGLVIPNPKAPRREIQDLPNEVLTVVFQHLQVAQDIATCMRVCRLFADIVHSDVYLQYRLELAHNGMLGGASSTLLVSEKLQRLRQYSSNFRNGVLHHETVEAHPEYLQQFRNLDWDFSSLVDGFASVLYGRTALSTSYLSLFTHRSAQAGIQSRRSMIPVGTHGDPTRFISYCATDCAQDLLVTVEQVQIGDMGHRRGILEIRFLSLSRSGTAPMDHPAAMVPCVQVVPPPGTDTSAHISCMELSIRERYAIWPICVMAGVSQRYFVEVFDWRAGTFISRIDLGTQPLETVPLDDSHLLVASEAARRLDIYSLSSSTSNDPLCTLQLPDLDPGESVVWLEMKSSVRPPTPEGYFRADPTRSLVLLTHHIQSAHTGILSYASHLLIPYATLRAQINRAASDPAANSPDSPDSLAPVPWQDWGPQGCLRLKLPRVGEHSFHVSLTPSGSRMPVFALDGPGPSASVYVFDVDPLVVRRARSMLTKQGLSDRSLDSESRAIVEDIEAALPGTVDPQCAAIPYVVYRFPLPPFEPDREVIAVRMTFTGFVIRFRGLGFRDLEESWTV